MKTSPSLLVLCLLGTASAAPFTDCGSIAKDLQIHIAGCSNTDPVCTFTAGQKATIEANFKPTSLTDSAAIKLSANMGIATIAFPLTPSEACGNWGLKCPAAPGSSQTLRLQVPIETGYPKIQVRVQLELVSSRAEKLICTSFPVQIK